MDKYIVVLKGKPFYVENDTLTPIEDGSYTVKRVKADSRTIAQNASLHLYCNQVADALNDAGLDMKKVIKADVSWSMFSVKEYMWKSLQKAILGKESTTLLKKDEIDTIYHQMNRLLAEKFGIHVPFPSVESMIFKQNY